MLLSPTLHESEDKCKIYIFMLLLPSDFFQHYVKVSSGFSQIKYFLRHEKLTFSIIQKSGGGQLTPPPCPPGSDATNIAHFVT